MKPKDNIIPFPKKPSHSFLQKSDHVDWIEIKVKELKGIEKGKIIEFNNDSIEDIVFVLDEFSEKIVENLRKDIESLNANKETDSDPKFQ